MVCGVSSNDLYTQVKMNIELLHTKQLNLIQLQLFIILSRLYFANGIVKLMVYNTTSHVDEINKFLYIYNINSL